VAVLVLAAIRIGLPEVLRRILVSQASQVLLARVEVGDVDLSLLLGGIALEDVAVWSLAPSVGEATASVSAHAVAVPERESVRATPEEPERPAAGPTVPSDVPVIAWKRVAVGLRWWPLFEKTVQLREVTIDSPRVAVDRLATGEINLLALAPPSEEESSEESAPAEQASDWTVHLDRVVLRSGGLRFRDLKVEESEPIEISVEAFEVRDVALRAGLSGGPTTAHLQLVSDDATLRLDAQASFHDPGLVLEAKIETRNLPLRRSRFYIPRVGWSALSGKLDAALNYRLESNRRDEVRGTVSLRELAVRVPNHEEPALAWRDLTVQLAPLDLQGRQLSIAALTLNGASLLFRPRGGDLLPLLTFAGGDDAEEDAAALATSKGETGEPASQSGEKPWHWSVAALRISDSRVRLLGDDVPIDVGVDAAIDDLADTGKVPGKGELSLAVAKGKVDLKGAVQVAPPGFGGTLRIADLPLPGLARAAGAVPRAHLQTGALNADLAVEVGLPAAENAAPARGDAIVRGKLSLSDLQAKESAPQALGLVVKSIDLEIDELRVPGVLALEKSAPAQDLRFQGRLAVAGLDLTGADPKAFRIGGRELEVDIAELNLPGLFPGTKKAEATDPIRIVLGDVRLDGPVVRLTRAADGFVLPGSLSAPQAADPEPPNAASDLRSIEVAVDALRVTKGSVALTDRTVNPSVRTRLSPLDVELQKIRWPDLSVEKLEAAAVGAERGKIDVYGGLAVGDSWFEIVGDKVALRPLNPYVTTFSGYTILDGTASVSTKAWVGKEKYYADSWLTLHDFDIRGGEAGFQQQYGVPLSVALALLRDLNGNIVLGVPLSGDDQGMKVGLLTVVRSALQGAIVNALASPLKLLGAVFRGKGGRRAAAPEPIRFVPGRAELLPEVAEQVDHLGELLASRPSVKVTLETSITTSDLRGLREQGLLEEWQGEGWLERLGAFTQGGSRRRVRDALENRVKGEVSELSPEDEEALQQWLAERQEPAPERLRALGQARLQQVLERLHEEGDIDSARVELREPVLASDAGTPEVRVSLGAVGSAARKPEADPARSR
jgi:hypothetical protein